MIINLNKFILEGKVIWAELEEMLDEIKKDPDTRLGILRAQRLHYLYQRTCSDLAKLSGFSTGQEIKTYLSTLAGRAYAHIHENKRQPGRFNPIKWFFYSFPVTFRKNITAFWIALAVILTGSLLGGIAIQIDKDAKASLMPFPHLMQDPVKRVAHEESAKKDRLEDKKSSFASYLISNNTKVSFFALSLGATWGVGTLILLFSNGIFLGATIADYIAAGQTQFMIGWLLPHGSIEIPAIILAGQAGFILASAMIGWGKPISFRTRLRLVSSDILTLMGGVVIMLIWAGFIEAFLSQYHEPFISYNLKIIFGCFQLLILIYFLFYSGKDNPNIRDKES